MNPIRMMVFILMSLSQCAQALTEQQQRIILAVDNNQTSEIGFIKDTVNINSGTFNIAGVKQVGKLYQQAFDQLGFNTQWVDAPKEINRAGHLVAKNKSNKGKKILLIGHMDTVFEKDSSFQTFSQNGDIAKGPGITDMKGGNAVIIYALKALKETNSLDNLRITVLLLGDEEATGHPTQLAREALIQAGKQHDLVLAFEPGSTLNKVVTARRGIATWTLNIKAKQGHSSQIFTPEFGEGAIMGAVHFLNQLGDFKKQYPYLTFNPGLIVGGNTVSEVSKPPKATAEGKHNIIPSQTVTVGDVRYLSKTSVDAFKQEAGRLSQNSKAPVQAQFIITTNTPSRERTQQTMALVTLLTKVNEELKLGDLKESDPRLRGAADIGFIDKQTPGLDGLGAIGKHIHSTEEQMHIPKTIASTQRLALFLHQLSL